MENIEVTKQFLHTVRENFFDYGIESYVYKEEKDIYKIFKTDKKKVLENKLTKLIKLEKLGLDFLTNPVATISYNREFIGYKMNYDFHDSAWFNVFLPLEDRVKYLKLLKEKLLILEEYGILYPDIKDDNLLINLNNGNLKFCDIDNVQIDGLPVDEIRLESQVLQEKNFLFDNRIHPYMHNIYTLEQAKLMSFSDEGNLIYKRISDEFDVAQYKVLNDSFLVKQKSRGNSCYLIDNLR